MIDPFCAAAVVVLLLWGIGDYLLSDPYIGHRTNNIVSNDLKTWENDVFGEDE